MTARSKVGNLNGRGVYTLENSDRYDGEWKNSKWNGRGAFTWASGNRYEVEYRDGLPNGLGRLTMGNDTFNGIWTAGCFKDGNRRASVTVRLDSCP